jgi:hypothetical protein
MSWGFRDGQIKLHKSTPDRNGIWQVTDAVSDDLAICLFTDTGERNEASSTSMPLGEWLARETLAQ